ncbi:MAG TPA: cytochrome c oxidase accessory protein CcoG [Gemmatimonadaceae bacterium]|nr:cytochrome c oxidase accessory protein CcoG [Gemmatimonadaceae bacterium]
MTTPAPAAAGRVLPTLNEDGSRRWIRPKPSHGHFWHRRRVVAYALMIVFFLIPYLRLHGKPLVLLDLPRRQFTLFGTTFLPTDTLLLMLLMASILIGIFLMTALAGRVWCGWSCPQTVYMEFLYRPIERLFEGGRSGSMQLDRDGLRGQVSPRRLGKYAVYLLLSLFLAHTFLAYFVGIDRLVEWVQRSPFDHPTSFAIMAITTFGIMMDFTWFREQTCVVACPYGRWQSVLLDRQSLIVAYDRGRGEPRGKGKDRAALGDCVECGACVITCPTGIDIRDGLQMECIHCTQCADACDAIMARVGKPPGLIRYTSQAALEGAAVRKLRPRVVLYPAALALTFGGFLFALGTKATADVTVLRGLGEPYVTEADGRVANQLRVKITNRAGVDHRYQVTVRGVDDGTVIAPENPLAVAAGQTDAMGLFVMLPPSAFHDGERNITVHIIDGAGFVGDVPYRLVGPEHDDDDAHRDTTHDGSGGSR